MSGCVRQAPEFKNVKTKGGFVYMNGDMTIYADEADWDEA